MRFHLGLWLGIAIGAGLSCVVWWHRGAQEAAQAPAAPLAPPPVSAPGLPQRTNNASPNRPAVIFDPVGVQAQRSPRVETADVSPSAPVAMTPVEEAVEGSGKRLQEMEAARRLTPEELRAEIAGLHTVSDPRTLQRLVMAISLQADAIAKEELVDLLHRQVEALRPAMSAARPDDAMLLRESETEPSSVTVEPAPTYGELLQRIGSIDPRSEPQEALASTLNEVIAAIGRLPEGRERDDLIQYLEQRLQP